MTNHAPLRLAEKVGLSSTAADASAGRFELAFMRHGAQTVLGRQFVSYPFHMTRPFALDPAIPSLLTVYQQSSSGGLYRAENLASRYELGRAAAAHVTTQAATIVHDCHGESAEQSVEITLKEDAFLALTPDPLVLFPGGSCSSRLRANLAPGAKLMLADAFALHDPKGHSRAFEQVQSDVAVYDAAGTLVVRDSYRVTGEALTGEASPIGSRRSVASFLLIGPSARLPQKEALAAVAADSGAPLGVSPLPNGAGWVVRCLAADAIAGRRVAESLFSLCVIAAFGASPLPRRK